MRIENSEDSKNQSDLEADYDAYLEELSSEAFLADGDGGEAVDERLIRRFYDEELPAGAAEQVLFLIAHFRDWHEASRTFLTNDSDAVK